MFSYPDSLVPVLRSVLVLPLCASVEPGLIVASEGRFCWILENVVRDNAGLHVGAQGNFDGSRYSRFRSWRFTAQQRGRHVIFWWFFEKTVDFVLPRGLLN